MALFIEQQKDRPETEQSWNLSLADLDEATADLSVKNPNTPEEAPLREPEDILAEMTRLDSETNELLECIRGLL